MEIMQLRPDPRLAEIVFRGVLIVLLAIAVGMLGSVVLLRGEMPAAYNSISNTVQVVASTVAAGAAAWVYYSRKKSLLLAHGAFAGATWTLANTFWFAYFVLIGEGLNYPTVADLGFIGVFLFLISGYQEGMARSSLPAWYAAPALAILPLFGLVPVFLLGVSGKTLTTLVVFVLAAVLISEALLRSGYRHPLLLSGTIAFAITHLFNSLDSTIPNLPWAVGVEAVGGMAVLSFSLLGLAFLQYAQEGET
ncbi:MAG TPA: hypothetical protein VE134_03325 [Methanomicrobiales archaeon]|nr:hypothetical protein [Methanomicrobiales archaeon]